LKKTELYIIDPDKPSLKSIKKVAGVLKGGGIIAFPTETVYGLFVNALDRRAVDRLYRLKKRPRNKSFTILISRFKDLDKFEVEIKPYAMSILKKFWPGPLTAILKTTGGKKIGFRMPDYKAVNILLKEVRLPIFAPSANISGGRECISQQDILLNFKGKIEAIVAAGRSPIGIPSTVVDLTNNRPKILREGVINLNIKNQISK
jgi:L-threonylcarbamoyladenylate synthase